MRLIDLSLRTFGRWTVQAEHQSDGKNMFWRCLCECGSEAWVGSGRLRDGTSRSCGCLSAEMSSERNSSHGYFGTRVYQIWADMWRRCHGSRKDSPRYGGRGITVDSSWKDFSKFLADMGEPPGPEFTLDRVNNNKGYELANCKWSTMKEQGRNRENNRRLTLNGKTQTLAAWAEQTGLGRVTITSRLDRGWSENDALTIPARKLSKPRSESMAKKSKGGGKGGGGKKCIEGAA